MNFNFRGERTTSTTTTNTKTNLLTHQTVPSLASLLNRSGAGKVVKTTSAFTIFVTASLIAILLLASPSFHHIPQAHAQGAPLNPATTQIINQIATQVASVHGGDSAQISQVLQQIALQISEDSNPGRAIQAVTQIFGQLAIDRQAPVSQALSQLTQQQASGQNVEQSIAQVGRQVAQGGDVSQAIVQAAQQLTPPQEGALLSEVRQEISQIATQVAQGTNTDQGQVDQILQQIATQAAEQGGNAEQAVTQVGQQVAQNPQGPVSQSIAQIAQQQASGQNVEQSIVQVGRQIATGQQNVTQSLTQVAVQEAAGKNADQ